jgi:hypothetical protein
MSTSKMAAKPPRFSVPLAAYVDACLGPALAAQGFAAGEIVTAWPDIVGARLAAASRPIKLEWPKTPRGVEPERREPATLVVRVAGPFALEMQHLAPQIVERTNAYFGWRCVGRILMKQGPVPRPVVKPAAPRPDPVVAARLAAMTGNVDDENLRAALARLGEAVAAKPRD